MESTEKLTLSNDVAFDGFALISTQLFLYINNSDLRTVFDAFYNKPNDTGTIVYTMNNGEDVTYDGFTKLIAVRDEGNNLITVVMEKGA